MAKSVKKRRDYYLNGRPGEEYGIWNSVDKRFVFGIREPTPQKADRKFCRVSGKARYAFRYQWAVIPKGWVNPPNPVWKGR